MALQAEQTNTVVLVNLPLSLVAAEQLDATAWNPLAGTSGSSDIPEGEEAVPAGSSHVLRALLAKFGRLAFLGVVPGLSRAVAVFEDSEQARLCIEAVLSSSETALGAAGVRGYYAMDVPVRTENEGSSSNEGNSINVVVVDTLRVPERTRNFLISPPGSPPIGWVQIAESSPATGGHTDVHTQAVRNMLADPSTANFTLDEGPAIDEDGTRHVLTFGHGTSEESSLPVICIDFSPADGAPQGSRPAPTRMPAGH